MYRVKLAFITFLFLVRFKNVQFEIAATENPGVFDVNAKFMGVPMDKVELVFQVRSPQLKIHCAGLSINHFAAELYLGFETGIQLLSLFWFPEVVINKKL